MELLLLPSNSIIFIKTRQIFLASDSRLAVTIEQSFSFSIFIVLVSIAVFLKIIIIIIYDARSVTQK